MKVLILSGGFRGGNTDCQCKSLFDYVKSQGLDVSYVLLSELQIGHCRGCNVCSESGTCFLNDDMPSVFDLFSEADVVIFATPVRFNGPSSVIKTMIDRFQELWNNPEKVSHKKRFMCLLANSGSDNPDIRPMRTVFRSFCYSFGGEWVGDAISIGTDRTKDNLAGDAIKFWDEVYSAVTRES